MLSDIAEAHPIQVMSLRYFNPIGADPKMRTGLQLPSPSHALGKMIEARNTSTPFRFTGTDYPTRDGSGIRDYIHVWDLAEAHVAALNSFDRVLEDHDAKHISINLGTGRGTTVRELLDAFNDVIEIPLTTEEAPRRPGDAVGAFTRVDRAQSLLNWTAKRSIKEGIRHSIEWGGIRDKVLADSA